MMSMDYLVLKTFRPLRDADKRLSKKLFRENVWQITLGFSLVMAVLGSISGLIISVLSHLNLLYDRAAMKTIGTLLILIAAPLYFLAAHCLDKLDLQQIGKK